MSTGKKAMLGAGVGAGLLAVGAAAVGAYAYHKKTTKVVVDPATGQTREVVVDDNQYQTTATQYPLGAPGPNYSTYPPS